MASRATAPMKCWRLSGVLRFIRDLPTKARRARRNLSEEWRTLAEQQRRLGPQARTLEYCADALWSVLRANDDELLSLQQAAEESGYSPDHLGRLLAKARS